MPTVSIQELCVATTLPLAKFNTAPEAKNKSENCNEAVPNAAQSLLVGVNPVVIVAEVNTLLVSVCEPHTVTTEAVFVQAVVTLTSSENVNSAHAPTASKVTHPVDPTVVL